LKLTPPRRSFLAVPCHSVLASAQLAAAFPDIVLAFFCPTCSGFFLNRTEQARVWRDAALLTQDGANSATAVGAAARLPFRRGKVGSYTDPHGVPHRLCDPCYARQRRHHSIPASMTADNSGSVSGADAPPAPRFGAGLAAAAAADSCQPHPSLPVRLQGGGGAGVSGQSGGVKLAPSGAAPRAMPAAETCDAPSPPHRRDHSLPSQPTDDRTGSVGAAHALLVICSGENLSV